MSAAWNVLVLCTGNSARSVLGECTLNHLGAGRVRAFSAGSQPTGRINPQALERLAEQGIATTGVRSKSWDEFARADGPPLDLVITVCANAAGEVCPVFRSSGTAQPLRTHWGVDDPAHVEPIAARRLAFASAHQILTRRIEAFLALPFETMPRAELQAALDQIGKLP